MNDPLYIAILITIISMFAWAAVLTYRIKRRPQPQPKVETPEPYPMHEKLMLVNDQSQVIHDFLEWVSDTKGFSLGEWQNVEGYRDEQFWPVLGNDRDLLAEFFDIDLKVLDDEKIAMLEAQRELNKEVYGA